MEIKKRLNVPATYFFKCIMDSIKYDIQLSTGEILEDNQLLGFEYVKKFGGKSKANILIKEVVLNEKYSFVTSTTRNSFTSSYQISNGDENSCDILYTEVMTSNGIVQRLNDQLVGLFLSILKKQQFKRKLKLIENSY